MNASTAKEEALFTLALGKPAAERGAFLDRECGGDVTLRRRVEALLAAHEQKDSVLATEVELAARPTLSVDVPDEPPDEAVGQTLGRYKLLEKIGEGGCGVVYVAEQTEPVRRRVALKIIKLGMDTKQVVARFEAERQALAMMDHPNIAKILDAGVTGTLGALASCPMPLTFRFHLSPQFLTSEGAGASQRDEVLFEEAFGARFGGSWPAASGLTTLPDEL